MTLKHKIKHKHSFTRFNKEALKVPKHAENVNNALVAALEIQNHIKGNTLFSRLGTSPNSAFIDLLFDKIRTNRVRVMAR